MEPKQNEYAKQLYTKGVELCRKYDNDKEAIPLFEKAVSIGSYPPAFLRLYMILSDRNQKDDKTQFYLELCLEYKDWFIDQAMTGDVVAQTEMGLYAGSVLKDHELTKEWFLKAAEQGYAPAQCNVASCFQEEKKMDQAIEWLHKSADQHYGTSMYYLGKIYKDASDGVPQDLEQAFEWFKKAANENYPEALCEMAELYTMEEDLEAAFQCTNTAANLGCKRAWISLAYYYYFGQVVDTDLKQAMVWFQKAAEEGDTESMVNLASILMNEIPNPTQENVAEGLHWLQKAAQLDSLVAIKKLAEYYDNEERPQEAFAWYLKAAEKGDTDSEYKVARACHTGRGTKMDMSQAIYWYTKAVEEYENHVFGTPVTGHVMSAYYLGRCYELGEGTHQDSQKALECYSLAQQGGSSWAKCGERRIKMDNMERNKKDEVVGELVELEDDWNQGWDAGWDTTGVHGWTSDSDSDSGWG